MATIAEYLNLAGDSYGRSVAGADRNRFSLGHPLAGWEQRARSNASWYRSGFQGSIFQHFLTGEVIVAFAGTQSGPAIVTQYASNFRILVHAIPNMAGAAHDMVIDAIRTSGSRAVSVVGHSLGGAIAQVVGFWTGRPFISFNGPGMKRHLIASRLNVLQPRQRSRSLRAGSVNDAVGICFSVAHDPIAGFGEALGSHIVLTGTGPGTHFPEAVAVRLGSYADAEPEKLCPGWSERM
jgi:hypothetical protein